MKENKWLQFTLILLFNENNGPFFPCTGVTAIKPDSAFQCIQNTLGKAIPHRSQQTIYGPRFVQGVNVMLK
jgi:hypothetical protein